MAVNGNFIPLKMSRKKQRLGEIAKAIALSAQGVGGRSGNNFRLGACITNRNHVLSASTNSYKTHRQLHRFYPYPNIHAEAGAILRLGIDQCAGCDLYVARVLKNNQLALAKPCEYCLELIKFAQIRNVYYSIRTGYERLQLV